jgi:hypothetical protein
MLNFVYQLRINEIGSLKSQLVKKGIQDTLVWTSIWLGDTEILLRSCETKIYE